jgi:hypothetical protein
MKNYKKLFAVLAMGVIATVGVFAQVTIGGGFSVSAGDVKVSGDIYDATLKGEGGFGGNFYLDYLLPISIPLSLGVEIGVEGMSFYDSGNKDTITAVPILARVAYHFAPIPKLDLYLLGKIGGAFGTWSGDYYDFVKSLGASIDDPAGFAFGFDLGAAYYFTPHVGVFAELGFDDYALETEASFRIYSVTYSATAKAPFAKFLTVGVAYKF